MIRVVGHRGAAGRAPENTLAAFRCGWELGADMLELDVRLTADGHAIALHDATLDRTTGPPAGSVSGTGRRAAQAPGGVPSAPSGSGRASEHTLAEIQALDAGAWFAPEFAGERIPTLAEALAGGVAAQLPLSASGREQGRGVRWLIELKRGDAEPARLVEAALAAIAAVEVAKAVRLISFDEALLAEARRRAPDLPRGMIAARDAGSLLDAAARQECVAVHAAATLVTPELIAAAHACGWLVNAWTINDAPTIARMASLGVDEITTDFPDLAVAELRRLRMRGVL